MRTFDKLIDHIITNKAFYSGVAIIMIVLVHVKIVDSHFFWSFFYAGFLGVDFFMLYSGYGLCYSYGKNPLWLFYKRRMARIAPLFLFMTTTICFIALLNGNKLSIWDWFCNLTTLNYYHIGGFYIEWYLCSMFLFYACFPVFYKICKWFCNKKRGTLLLNGILTICVILAIMIGNPKYNVAIGRIPIYFLGILIYLDKRFVNQYLVSFCVFLAIVIGLYFGGWLQTFFILYMSAPIVLFLIAFILKKINKIIKFQKVKSIIEWLGNRSLEIYVTNIIICYSMTHVGFLAGGSLYYFIGFLVITPFIIFINRKLLSRII